ncbi:helix-turn-helix domain-containing protein [Nonomuraea gerenzanensis]|uniref:Transcriptional regulator, AraC family n=1 Tax=Nonomuraea gerenzanensis TaxID=93944 RepID=A0A1M4E5C6_9ACTN|nr:helix-turn-helix domain-containing protein [Nonomuraea gerenzanensis]UBU16222.1 helix-turn-helix domain-containing protein [Nonomuraea gerenzanensis]SBO94036.1 Transcriptional regulator, AraC family [Nonomuraea gerenzanensis]
MGLEVESRPSDSPYVQRVWRSRSDDVGRMISVAAASWDLVFWEHGGQVSAAVQGPETKASPAPVPAHATFFGISFAVGASMPHLPMERLVDGNVPIPDATRRSFHLKGSTWRLPGYDDAEWFVRRLVREEILVLDPVVAAVLGGRPAGVSERTVQRRFVAATGLTRGAVRRIDRARRAAVLLRDGAPAQDVVHRLGYFDQPHLARSLSRYVGRTATQLADPAPPEPLSLLYRT